jgi:hypothetical protein
VAYSESIIEAGGTRVGRWLRTRRVKISLWIAVVEGLIAAFSADIGRWTLIALAVVVLAFYLVAGRRMKWDVARELSWIAAASQALAILVIIFAFVLKLIAIVAVVAFAVIALVYLFVDHRQRT